METSTSVWGIRGVDLELSLKLGAVTISGVECNRFLISLIVETKCLLTSLELILLVMFRESSKFKHNAAS